MTPRLLIPRKLVACLADLVGLAENFLSRRPVTLAAVEWGARMKPERTAEPLRHPAFAAVLGLDVADLGKGDA